jgi:hypothetical protein
MDLDPAPLWPAFLWAGVLFCGCWIAAQIMVILDRGRGPGGEEGG